MTQGGRFEMTRYWIALAAIALVTLWPILSLLLSLAATSLIGCSEWAGGTPAPCVVMGFDISSQLATMAFLAFGIMYSIPIGLLLFVLWFAVLTLHYVRSVPR